MNRTDRLFGYVLLLESRGVLRAEDLARAFEVSVRTVYRDIQALSEMGVPVVALPRRGYQLMEGYFLPPLSFTPLEAAALHLGGGFVARYGDDAQRRAVRSAIEKIEAVLPKEARSRLEAVRPMLEVLGTADGQRVRRVLGVLREAVEERRAVWLAYRAGGTGPVTEREVDPYGLVFYDDAWHLVGYCHLRQDMRDFRVQRVLDARLLERRFTVPDNFSLREHFFQSWRAADERPLQEVVVWVAPDALDAVRAERGHAIRAEEPLESGCRLRLAVRGAEEVLPWVLAWQGKVELVQPIEWRRRLHDLLRTMLRAHGED
jgi:predicted DNA-binding transcriptional regulator YafY